ncbi:DegV family protein [soil metagenome]
MAGARIVTDSSCDLAAETTDPLGIAVVPLTIRFGDQELVDRSELSPEQFYERMAASATLPETAAPAPGAFEQAFRGLADDGADSVICVNLSADLSATYASARNAAAALAGEIDVRVIDSHSITGGLGTQVLQAAAAAADGRTADDIVAMVEDLARRTRVYGALDTLDNLKRGGRIGGAQAMLGTLLSIKPIVDISTGVVEEAAKARTRKKAIAWLRDKLFEQPTVEHLAVLSGGAPDVGELCELLAPRYGPDDYRTGTIGPVIGTHGGPRVLGLTWVA